MTTEYKLLLQDECTFVPLDNKESKLELANRLDVTTASLLVAYNDGNKQEMDEVRDLQTGLAHL